MDKFFIVAEFEDGSRKCYTSEIQEKNYQFWESILRKAHKKKIKLYCNCHSPYPLESKRLYVAYYRKSDTFAIKTFPGTKENHNANCFFRRGVITISYKSYREDKTRRPFESISEQGKEAIILIPEVGIREKKKNPQGSSKPRERPTNIGKSRSRPRAKLAKFLSTIWELSNLNTWTPGRAEKKHTLFQATKESEIKKALDKIFISKTKSLDSFLLLPCKSKDEENYTRNIKIVKRCVKRRERPFVLNFLPKFDKENTYLVNFFKALGLDSLLFSKQDASTRSSNIYSTHKTEYQDEQSSNSNAKDKKGIEKAVLLPVKYYLGIPFLWVNIDDLVFFKEKKNQAMLKLYLNHECEIVYFAHIDVPKVINSEVYGSEESQQKGEFSYNSKVLNISFMFLSKELIPVESSYEVQMEAFLRRIGVKFKKPFASPDFPLVPDFIVFGKNGQNIYIEVFGMHTKEYLQRKADKINFYNEKKVKVLSWDPKRDPDLKNFEKEISLLLQS